LDGKTEFTILDGIWTKNGQLTNRLLAKIVKIDYSRRNELKMQHFFAQTLKSGHICPFAS